ncbi:hypothetical protein FB45DRAFT_902499, partial [Roridomyces roridus]
FYLKTDVILSMPHTAKTAIVTGIGRASAVALSKAGWNVVLTARRLEALEETASLCETTLVLAGDITDEEFVKKLFQETVERFGRLDLLFNNAGISSPGVPMEQVSLDAFQNVMSVNVVGPFLCACEAVRVFKNQTPMGGRIINNGSLSAHTPRPMSSPYTMSKHAISGLSKCIALDGRAFDITCTQIDIGNANTEMVTRISNGVLQPDGRVVAEIYLAGLPSDVSVPHFTIMASKAPFAGRG